MPGPYGKFLEINLETRVIKPFEIKPEYTRDFVGGASLAARLFLDIADPLVDPLGANNPLLIMNGPLAGTNFPGSSRFVVCGKSPLTGIWGESASGGSFGADLKKAGMGGLIISGVAAGPMYLFIDDGRVEIMDAQEFWGKETFEVVDTLKKRHGGDGSASVITIGPAGEHLVKYAAICNDKAHYLGRTGMGAVMGSKNLKAVVVKGTRKVPLADGDAYKTARKNTLQTSRESMIATSFSQIGTAAAVEMGLLTGDLPIKNWTVGLDDDISEAIGGAIINETILKKHKACFACPVACKPEILSEDDTYPVEQGPGPEYETVGTFGSMQMNLNLKGLSKANDRCNRLGLDTISCGATIAFIMEAFEKGLLQSGDMDGLDITWGNIDDSLALIEKIAVRQGFGDRAAEGSAALALSLPAEALDFMVTTKKLELPMHDPRGFHGMGLAYMMSPRGGCHLQHSCQAVEQGMVDWEEAGLKDDYEGPASEGKAEMVFITENIGQMANTACFCHFVHWAIGLQNLLDGFNAVTGLDCDLEAFMKIGQRAWVLKRAIGNLMGVTRADDVLPKRVLTPLAEGGSMGTVPDVDLMRTEYYSLRGLDEKGVPLPEVLDKLNLGFLKEKLQFN